MTELDLSLRGADEWRTGRRSFLAQAGGFQGAIRGPGVALRADRKGARQRMREGFAVLSLMAGVRCRVVAER